MRPTGAPSKWIEPEFVLDLLGAMQKRLGFFVFAALLVGASRPAAAQLLPAAEWAVRALNQYQVFPNLTYLAGNRLAGRIMRHSQRGDGVRRRQPCTPPGLLLDLRQPLIRRYAVLSLNALPILPLPPDVVRTPSSQSAWCLVAPGR
jgi:hypothetical protein